MTEDRDDVNVALNKRLREAEGLLESLTSFERVEGISKLKKKIRQELKFLQKIEKGKNSDSLRGYGLSGSGFLKCTNLTHLSGVVDVLARVLEPVSVLKTFNLQNDGVVLNDEEDSFPEWPTGVVRKLEVDVVSDKVVGHSKL